MKFRALVVAAFVLALGAAAVHAGASQSSGINGGLTMPTGDASDFSGTGFHLGGTYCYKVNGQFGVGGDVNFHMLGEKDLGIVDTLGISVKTKLSAIQGGAHVKYFFPMKDAKVEPYIKAGVGMYNLSYKATASYLGVSDAATSSESKFGFSGGLGMTMAISDKASWGVEALYHTISTEGSATNLFTLGASYNFMIGK